MSLMKDWRRDLLPRYWKGGGTPAKVVKLLMGGRASFLFSRGDCESGCGPLQVGPCRRIRGARQSRERRRSRGKRATVVMPIKANAWVLYCSLKTNVYNVEVGVSMKLIYVSS